MHIVSNAWDPFFGDGTKQVLTSKLSKKFPIPDALLGAFGYLLDLILGISGRTDRWHSQPWIVLLLGVVVSLLSLTGFLLILAQFFFIHEFCTLCLASAIISFIIAALAGKEILASIRFVRKIKQQTGSFRKAIFES